MVKYGIFLLPTTFAGRLGIETQQSTANLGLCMISRLFATLIVEREETRWLRQTSFLQLCKQFSK